jgi:hypothetical protein
MNKLSLRAPNEDDWPELLALAQQSLVEMPSVPSQLEWITNRRTFSPADGIQRHFVAIIDGHIVGYACAEHRNAAHKGHYRLFVVVKPSDRSTLGTHLLGRLRELLIDLGASYAWVGEYDSDSGFVSYLTNIGFERLTTYPLDDGASMTILKMDAPFQSLVQKP